MAYHKDLYLTVNQCSIRYREAGNGPVILLVHGIAGYLEEWEMAMDILRKDFRVVALDLPGHGLSEKPDLDYTIDALSDYLKAFILALKLERICLVGHSLGGAISLSLAMKNPQLVERLVLLNSAFTEMPFPIRLGSFKLLPRLVKRLPFSSVKASARRTFYDRGNITKSWLQDAYRYINEPGALRVMFSIIRSNMTLRGLKSSLINIYYREIKTLTIPALILYGKNDKILPNTNSTLLHQHLSGSKCFALENCGHELQIECCREFCAHVAGFFPKDRFTFLLFKNRYAICRLESSATTPDWPCSSNFYSVTKTPDELSVVCCEDAVPHSIKSENGWRILKIQGVLDFSLTGILASVSAVLANAALSIFALSTFDTDYILVKDKDIDNAVTALEKSGHSVIRE